MPTTFPTNNCNPRLIMVDDGCGCTLTRAAIRPMTQQDFEDQDLKEVGMDKIYAQTKEARMTGVMEKTLMDLLLSRMAPVKQTSLTEQGSIIAPWSLVPQRHNINANYWNVVSGAAHPTAGSGGVPPSAWQIVVKQHAGVYSTDLPGLERFFLPGNYVTVVYKGTANVGKTVTFKIYDSVNADSGGVHQAKITLIPNKSDAGWAAMIPADKAVYQPIRGLVIPQTNSVSDYESWCYNHPAINTTKFLEFWWQTSRRSFCYNDEYLKALQSPYTSEFFKKFRQLDLTQQRKQEALQSDKEWYNTIFFGEQINENQTQALYASLPRVLDPYDATCLLEYKSNTIGIRPQLVACGKVTDLAGADLNFDVVRSMLYDLKRQREVDSGSVQVIDVLTDRHTKANILSMMTDYYKKKYNLEVTRFAQMNQPLKFDGNIVADFTYDLYDFPEEMVQLAVFTDTYFDDYLSAVPSTDKAVGRKLWFIDWSDIVIGIGKVSSVQRDQPNAATDALYKCVITPNVRHVTLSSKKYQVRVPNPNRHAIIENFSGNCPIMTAAACTMTSTST